jgi:amino acid adenylation domain-containing protein
MSGSTLSRWCRQVARQVPEAIAIDLGTRQVSYRELDLLAAQVRLALADFGPQSRIALLAATELATYAAYLGILQQGQTVVPLGPASPVAMNQKIVELAQAQAVLVGGSASPGVREALAATGIPVLSVSDTLAATVAAPQEPQDSPDQIAYILFTSGSTGRPKGVPITHRNVCAYLSEVIPRYELGPGARLSHTFALTFDLSVYDLFGSWCSGAALVVPRKRELLAPALYAANRQLTHWFSVPSLVSYAQRIGGLKPHSMPGLKWSLFCGEPLSFKQASAWHEAASESKLANVYGPTELTISCAGYVLPRDRKSWPVLENGTIPIGEVHGSLESLVAGEGELCVRGPQRFGGYLDPADNANRFLTFDGEVTTALPADRTPSTVDWYRTGDRVCRTADGLIHLGRIDRQVKIRGHRIELADVEGVLRSHPGIRDAAVFVLPDDQDGLVLAAALCGDEISEQSLSAFIGTHRPAYMVPSVFLWLSGFPLNASGKTDYHALAARAAGLWVAPA